MFSRGDYTQVGHKMPLGSRFEIFWNPFSYFLFLPFLARVYNKAMQLFSTLCGVFVILVLSEFLWRRQVVKGEGARKFVHITVGTYIAFWPYFLSWWQIQLLCVAFFVVVGMSVSGLMLKIVKLAERLIPKRLQLPYLETVGIAGFLAFRTVHRKDGKPHGELFFPLGIGLAALLTPPPAAFAVAVLHLSLADGLAALIGLRFGKTTAYKVFGYTKTMVGSLTFLLISALIMLGYAATHSSSGANWLMLLAWLPLAAMLIENAGFAGTDNLLVPLLVIATLNTYS
jgi:phytol kinase